jgi:hypothetical protein
MVRSMYENWSVMRRWPLRALLLADLVTIMPDLGKHRLEAGVVADSGAGHQKLMKQLESEMSA